MEREARNTSSHGNCSCSGCVKAEQLTRKSSGDVAVLGEPVGRPRRRGTGRESSQPLIANDGKSALGGVTIAGLPASGPQPSSPAFVSGPQQIATTTVTPGGLRYSPQITENRVAVSDHTAVLGSDSRYTRTVSSEVRSFDSLSSGRAAEARREAIFPEQNSITSSRTVSAEAQRTYAAEGRTSSQQIPKSAEGAPVERAAFPASSQQVPSYVQSVGTDIATGTGRELKTSFGTERNALTTESVRKEETQRFQTEAATMRSQLVARVEEAPQSVRSQSSAAPVSGRDPRPEGAERGTPTSTLVARAEPQRVYAAEARSSSQPLASSNQGVFSPASSAATRHVERVSAAAVDRGAPSSMPAARAEPQRVYAAEARSSSHPLARTSERVSSPASSAATRHVEKVSAAAVDRGAATSMPAARAEPQRVYAAQGRSSSQPLAGSSERVSSPASSAAVVGASSSMSQERSRNVQSAGLDRASRLEGGAGARIVARTVAERNSTTSLAATSRHRGADVVMAAAPERHRARQATSQHAAALERRRVEVLGRIQRVLERATPSNQRGMTLSQIMRLEVATKILELLDEEEYQGISELRSGPRLSALRRRRLSPVRGAKPREQESSKSKERKERRKRERGDAAQPTSEASLAPSGASVAVKIATPQKGAIAKSSTPSKSLDIFQAKIDDDGNDELQLG